MHMSQHGNLVADSHLSDMGETGARCGDPAILPSGPAPDRAIEEAGCSIARLLNGPLTALLIYMEELRQHSHRLCENQHERDHLQKVVENALLQTERVCALVKEVGGVQTGFVAHAARHGRVEPARESNAAALATLPSDAGRKPLTKREREVLNLISEGFSNKQGALRMHISP